MDKIMTFKQEIIAKKDQTTQFNKHTLDLVVVELRFDEIPENDFQKLNLKFYPKIIKEFQYKQEVMIKEIFSEINLQETSHKSSFNQKPSFLYKDSTKNTEKTIAVKPFSFSLEYSDPQKKYEGFENFRDSFTELYNDFKEEFEAVLGTSIAPIRLGLRKINKIDTSLLEKHNIKFLDEISYFEDQNYSIFKEISSKEANCTVVIRSGIITEKDKNSFVIDLDIYQDKPSELIETSSVSFKDLLEDFNLKIFNIYSFLVGDDFINNYLNSD